MEVQRQSIRDPAVPPAIRTLAVEVWRRAEAMGLFKPDPSPPSLAATSDIVRLVRHIRDVGIARQPALRFDNVEVPSQAEVASLLRMIIDALEASPVAKYEWPAVSRVFEPEQLASLLGISVSSLRRYLSGSRDTPDDVAARLHFLALVTGDLAGAYNDVGIRRWFDRKRTALDGKTPAALLSGEWNPDSPGPHKVRALAQSLVALSAT
jgi:transcriptional regulator with XRE-family HTH domain